MNFSRQNPPSLTHVGIRRGFGLVEVLVVVAVVAVLATLVLGAYQRTIGAAQGAANLNNHRVIARGLLAYAVDHNNQLPWGSDASSAPMTTSPYPKTLCLGGYVGDARVFFSPKFWRRWNQTEGLLLVINSPSEYPNAVIPWGYPSYACNRYGAMPVSTDGRRPANLTRVGGDGNLSKLMLTRDVYQAANDTPSKRYGGGTYWFAGDGNLPSEKDSCAGQVYASFADGHAEGFRRETMEKMLRSSGSGAPLFSEVYTRN